MPPDVPAPDASNPDVRSASVWEWTGFWSALLFVLDRLQQDLGIYPNPPWYVSLAVVLLPVIIRYVRQKVTGLASSFRRRDA